jgi:starch synthase (maltosyl-transferring)
MVEFYRGNLFVNTPDILPEVLQRGGPPAFKMRAALATTLSSVWGIYSGFELCESAALSGKEEYLDSEKYEVRMRDWDQPGNIKAYLSRLNQIRRDNPALQAYRNLRFYAADNPHVLFYGKMTPDRSNVVLVAANLDPFAEHDTTLHLPLEEIGIGPDETYELHELLADRRQLARGATHAVRLDPQDSPAHVYLVNRWQRLERDRERDLQHFY